jgi:ATP-dependent helicase/nuclease subunit A
MRTLSEEQMAAIQAPGPVCLTASAGSGKTSVLVAKFLNLLQEGIGPTEILAVTFTRKSGKELRDRILLELTDASPALQSAVEKSPWIGTLHSACLNILKTWGEPTSFGPPLDVADPFRLSELVSEVRKGWMDGLDENMAKEAFALWTPSDLEALSKEALSHSYSIGAALSADSAATDPVPLLRKLLLPLLDLWDKTLEAKGLCSFDGLEMKALKLLKANASARAHFQANFKAVLVDEFQDTSPRQWSLIETLMGANEKKLFVVGDPKQSIYRFRGAEVDLFLGWARSIESQGGSALALRTCFRSSHELVGEINKLAEVLFSGSPLAEVSLRAGREPSGTPPLEVQLYGGLNPTEASLMEQKKVAETVAERLARGTPPSEIAILFRSGDRMELFAAELANRRIPVAFEPSVSLFSTREVQGIYAYLRTILDPLDDYYLGAFLRSSFVGYSAGELLRARKSSKTLLEHLPTNPKLDWLLQALEEGLVETENALRLLFESTRAFPLRHSPLYGILGMLFETPTVLEACLRLDAWEKEEVRAVTPLLEHDPMGVRLLTVHSAKGLEFNEVFLVDLCRKAPNRTPWLCGIREGKIGARFRKGPEILSTPAFTESWETSKREDHEESKRVLYVALTRAKESVTLLLPENRDLAPKNSWAETLAVLSPVKN